MALRSLGFIVTEQEIIDLKNKLDPDHSGSMDSHDFLCAISDVYNKEDNEDKIRMSFSILDKENTGII